MSVTLRKCALTASVVVVAALPALAGCKKDPPAPVVDAAPPPPPTQEAPTVLVPLEEDAGDDAGVDAGKKATGPYVNPNVARLKQCCNQLASEGKRLGSSPEAGLFVSAAAQCSAMASQVGASGNVPELGALRTLLAGRTLPAMCAGF